MFGLGEWVLGHLINQTGAAKSAGDRAPLRTTVKHVKQRVTAINAFRFECPVTMPLTACSAPGGPNH
jgi:hypothetical protein